MKKECFYYYGNKCPACGDINEQVFSDKALEDGTVLFLCKKCNEIYKPEREKVKIPSCFYDPEIE